MIDGTQEAHRTHSMATICMSWPILVVAVAPTPLHQMQNTRSAHRQDGEHFGETTASRTGYTFVSMFCMSLLAGMIGYRVRQIDRRQLANSSLTSILVYLLYFFSMSFVLSAALVESGLGLSTLRVCHGAIMLCLAFYVSSKVIMYLFLVERAHALRAPYMRRGRDWLWVAGTLTIAAGFGTIAVAGFVWPTAEISLIDGRCRIGLPRYVTIPLMTFDIVINVCLTLTFVYLLSPLVRAGELPTSAFPASHFTKCLAKCIRQARTRASVDLRPANQAAAKKIEKLLWRTFIGSCLVLIPTAGNLASLTSLKGRELGWVCLTVCTFDITWTVCVFHWLTMGASELDDRMPVVSADTPSASEIYIESDTNQEESSRC